MSQTVHLEVFYPHPPERVWQVLTNRHALANWMMENDFEPTLGHKFQFYSQPLPNLRATIQCEVVELEKPTRLAYTWRESPSIEPSLVVWTLTAVAGGTQLRLKHYQYSYTTAVARSNRSDITTHAYQDTELACASSLRFSGSIKPPNMSRSDSTLLKASNTAIAPQLPIPIHMNWNYYLNHRLPDLLRQN